MATQLFFLVFIGLALIVIATKAVAITKEGERLVVFRLGELFGVYPPGFTVLIPYIDKGVKVRVDQIAGWKKLPEKELRQKLAQAVIEKSA
jgi:regulator of protease activity HflC (stomatin/prohibitin superfamily)